MAAVIPSLMRLAQPRRFLFLISLRIGTELILLTLVINKVSGFYGLLALFTGFHLSSLQLSMYLYSILALALAVYLSPHIRLQSPLQCLALAYFYALDSLVNVAYTAAFAVGWFVVLVDDSNSDKVPGGKTISDTAGFTDPLVNASRTEIQPPGNAPGVVPVQDDGGAGDDGAMAVAAGTAELGDVMLHSGSLATFIIIIVLWAIRLYFIIVVFAYARQVLHVHLWRARQQQHQHRQQSRHKGSRPDIIVTSGNSPGAASSSSTGSGAGSSGASAGAGGGKNGRERGRGRSTSPSGSGTPNAKQPSRTFRPTPSNTSPSPPLPPTTTTSTTTTADLQNPFSPSKPAGHGWTGTLGRAMLSLGQSYWFGSGGGSRRGDFDLEWMGYNNHDYNSNGIQPGPPKFNRHFYDAGENAYGHEADSSRSGAGGGGPSFALQPLNTSGGIGERERRRRSGTGPPPRPHHPHAALSAPSVPSAGMGLGSPPGASAGAENYGNGGGMGGTGERPFGHER